jgi:ribonuclease VapC
VVVDTSALVAVLLAEPGHERLLAKLAEAEDPVISAATLLEASIVMLAKTGEDGVEDLDRLLAAAEVRCVAVDLAQAHLARNAYARHGKGRAPAGLNYGDCFAYALAQATSRALLFTGADLARTDVVAAS